MNPEDIGDDVAGMVTDHEWIPLAALLVGLVVRLLKDDTRRLPTVPPRWRPWLALGLGLLSGVLDKAAEGHSWAASLAGGLVAGGIAIVGHDTIVASIRDGKEPFQR